MSTLDEQLQHLTVQPKAKPDGPGLEPVSTPSFRPLQLPAKGLFRVPVGVSGAPVS
ncbi:hypothetical protein WDY66_10735 [Dermacoccus nishinomiyaensis]|uniref:hypothetical protein n=1 Tax=Dermacoccus nishinomiyaensis TaxID=1274 RepID=UPI0030CA628C